MKIIVTGGAGRLGQTTIHDLKGRGHEVLCVDLTEPAGAVCESHAVDLKEARELYPLFEGADAVVHLARERFPYTEANVFDPVTQTWRISDAAGDAERFSRNVAMTYSVLAVAMDVGVKRVVAGSSLAVYGFYYPVRPLLPDAIPIDEDHPRRPQDPYGLSKLVGEDICEAFAAKSDMQITSLRFAGIATEAIYRRLEERRGNPIQRGFGSFWSYIDHRDAAEACRLALEVPLEGHQALNVSAPTTFMDVPTRDLIERYLPSVRRVTHGRAANYCGYDTEKARRLLGFEARHLMRV